MPAAPTQRPLSAPAATRPPVAPNPPSRRLALLFKLFLVPAVVVCLPSLFVNYFFGSRPAPKAGPPEAAFAGLRESLERAARARLPEGGTTFGARFEELTLHCPPAETDARLETLRETAVRAGGTLTDQSTDAAGRHLLVELPEDHLRTFRRQFAPEPPPPAPVEPTPTATSPENGRVFLHVTLAP